MVVPFVSAAMQRYWAGVTRVVDGGTTTDRAGRTTENEGQPSGDPSARTMGDALGVDASVRPLRTGIHERSAQQAKPEPKLREDPRHRSYSFLSVEGWECVRCPGGVAQFGTR